MRSDLSINESLELFISNMEKASETYTEKGKNHYLWENKDQKNLIHNEDKYKRWSIMHDTSVKCDGKFEEQKCVIEGKKEDDGKCENLTFYPIEIVSPKLKGNRGLKILENIFKHWLYQNGIVYLTNESQGLHINISHPHMVPWVFIRIWKDFEYVIFATLPLFRRQKSDFFFPINKNTNYRFNQKYSSVHVHDNNDIEQNRLEIRIYEGTMILEDIYIWTKFCMSLLVLSIMNPYFDVKDMSDVEKLKILLDLIEDKAIRDFMVKRYNENNSYIVDTEEVYFGDANENVYKKKFDLTQ
jgi:hypothetical protein